MNDRENGYIITNEEDLENLRAMCKVYLRGDKSQEIPGIVISTSRISVEDSVLFQDAGISAIYQGIDEKKLEEIRTAVRSEIETNKFIGRDEYHAVDIISYEDVSFYKDYLIHNQSYGGIPVPAIVVVQAHLQYAHISDDDIEFFKRYGIQKVVKSQSPEESIRKLHEESVKIGINDLNNCLTYLYDV